MHYHVCFRQVTRVVSAHHINTMPVLCLVSKFLCILLFESLDPHNVQMGTPSSSTGLPTMPPPECEPSPYPRYPTLYPQPPQGPLHQHLLQPPPPIHHSSSAFCPMPPQAHHDHTGEYDTPIFNFFKIQFSKLNSETKHTLCWF